MLPVLVLTSGPISTPGVGARLLTPSMKSLPQNHGDLERSSLTSKDDEHASGGRFEPGCLFWRDVFCWFSIFLISAKNGGGRFLCHFAGSWRGSGRAVATRHPIFAWDEFPRDSCRPGRRPLGYLPRVNSQ